VDGQSFIIVFQQQQQLFYGHCRGQPMLAGIASLILLEQSFTYCLRAVADSN